MIRLTDYKHVVIFTGAGMSAESGVPTYRGRGGIWSQYRYEEYACEAAFRRDPDKVLDFHELRRGRVLACEPHAGHRHLAQLQARHPSLAIITQNIDGMHQRAGGVVSAELHGSLWRMRCPRHGVSEDAEAAPYSTKACPDCGLTLRPDITWFEDPVDHAVFAAAGRLIERCDLFVSIGTSAVVWPAAGLIPLHQSPRPYLVEVNPEETEGSEKFDETYRQPASELDQILCA